MPVDLCFGEAADRALTAIEADPTQSELAARINDVLIQLEADPGDRRVRRRSYRAEAVGAAMRGIPLRVGPDDWLILWEEHPAEPGTVIIHYIGRDL